MARSPHTFSLDAPPLVWLEERHAARRRRGRWVAATVAAMGGMHVLMLAWAHLA